MKKYWVALTFAVAILCLTLTGKIFTIGYHWEVSAIPIVLIWAAAILGIPSGFLLLFYICRFLIVSAIQWACSIYNKSFLCVFWFGVIGTVSFCLCPPWLQISCLNGSNIKATKPIGYSFLWDPPYFDWSYSGITIDHTRLILHILTFVLITAGLLFTLAKCRSDKNS